MKNVKYTLILAIVAGFLVACGGGGSKSDKIPPNGGGGGGGGGGSETTISNTPSVTPVNTASCSGSVVDIGEGGSSFNYRGTYKHLSTYKQCSNMQTLACESISFENGVLKTALSAQYEIDMDTCKKVEINANATTSSKIDKADYTIQEDTKGKYVAFKSMCDEMEETETIIASIPLSKIREAIRTIKFTSKEGSSAQYIVQEEGKYFIYFEGGATKTKTECRISDVKYYFKDNALVAEDYQTVEPLEQIFRVK